MDELMLLEVDPFLYRKVEKVAQRFEVPIEDAAVFLLHEVIAPVAAARGKRMDCARFSRPKGDSTHGAMGETNAEAQRRGGKEAAR